MATLIDADYISSTFNIHSDVKDSRITPYIFPAERRLKKWVGEDNFANAELVDLMKLAEGLLTMHFLIRNLNTAIRGNGLVRSEQREGETTIQYLSPTETAQTEEAYLIQAEEVLGDLITDASLIPEIIIDESES